MDNKKKDDKRGKKPNKKKYLIPMLAALGNLSVSHVAFAITPG